jgi:hypothetical protein
MSAARNITLPTGYAFVGAFDSIGTPTGAYGTAATIHLIGRIADGTEASSVNFTTDGAGIRSVYVRMEIDNVEPNWNGLFDGVQVTTLASASSSTPNPPSNALPTTHAWGDNEILWLSVTSWTGTTVTLSSHPASYTAVANEKITSQNPSLAVSYRNVAALSEDPGTFTLSASSTHTALTIAIRNNESFVPVNRLTRLDVEATYEAEPALRLSRLDTEATYEAYPALNLTQFVVEVAYIPAPWPFELDTLDAGIPVLGSPELLMTHEFELDDLSSGEPALGEPELSQTHNFVLDDLDSGTSTLDSPVLSQNHQFVLETISSGEPILGEPMMGQDNSFILDDLVTETPVLGEPELSQMHGFILDDLDSGTPTLESPELSQDHQFILETISSGVPILGEPRMGQDSFILDDLFTGTPVIGEPELNQNHGFILDDLLSGPPTLGSPEISQTHSFILDDLTSGVPRLRAPRLNAHLDGGGDCCDDCNTQIVKPIMVNIVKPILL